MRHALISLAVLAIGSSGCTTDNDSAIVLLHNQAPGLNCVTSPSLASPFLARGLIDAQSDIGYLFTPLLQNEAPSVDGLPNSQRVAFIEGANVDLVFEDGLDVEDRLGEAGLVNFSVPFTGTIQPDNGLTSIQFPILPAGVLEELRDVLPGGTSTLVQARVRVFGNLGGGDFESTSLNYPIDVCNQCLVVNNGACADLPGGFVPRTGGECVALQDSAEPVDCCTDPNGNFVCPAVRPPAAVR